MSGWLSIIMAIINLIVGRMNPNAQAFKGRDESTEIDRIAKMVVQVEPQLDLGCVRKMLPGLLDKLARQIEQTGFENMMAMVPVVFDALTELVRCQLSSLFPQSMDPAAKAKAEAAINEKLLSCAVKALLPVLFQGADWQSALSSFFSCVLGGAGGDTGTGGGGGGGFGGFEIRPVQRCAV